MTVVSNPVQDHPNRLILAVSFLQGVLMYILYRAEEANQWPADEPVWLLALIAALACIPVFFVLSAEAGITRRSLAYVAAYGTTVTAIGAYTGLQTTPTDFVRPDAVLPAALLTMGIATFKALMYTQTLTRERFITYRSLLNYSWRNFLLFGLGCLFTLLCVGLLFLWAGLFRLIDVDFFGDIFEEPWFLFPAVTTAFGFAVIIFRSLGTIIDSIARLVKIMIRFLLPALALLAVTFLCFLPFTGLQPLWDTNYGSTMMLWLQALLLFAVNAVYQAETEEHPYPLFLHRLIYAGIASMPVYSILVFYGLLERIGQHGLTVARCWGLVVAFVLACFALGYMASVLLRRDRWLAGLSKVNIGMGLLLMVIMVFTNTPLLNIQGITARSQLNRVLSGAIEPQDLDFNYFRWQLGRQGWLALEEFKTRFADTDPVLASRLDSLYREGFMSPAIATEDELDRLMMVWPPDRLVPATVKEGILTERNPMVEQYYAVFSDLDADGTEEIVVIMAMPDYVGVATLWFLQGSTWQSFPMRIENFIDPATLARAIQANEVSIEEPRWMNLRVGDGLLVPMTPPQ